MRRSSHSSESTLGNERPANPPNASETRRRAPTPRSATERRARRGHAPVRFRNAGARDPRATRPRRTARARRAKREAAPCERARRRRRAHRDTRVRAQRPPSDRQRPPGKRRVRRRHARTPPEQAACQRVTRGFSRRAAGGRRWLRQVPPWPPSACMTRRVDGVLSCSAHARSRTRSRSAMPHAIERLEREKHRAASSSHSATHCAIAAASAPAGKPAPPRCRAPCNCRHRPCHRCHRFRPCRHPRFLRSAVDRPAAARLRRTAGRSCSQAVRSDPPARREPVERRLPAAPKSFGAPPPVHATMTSSPSPDNEPMLFRVITLKPIRSSRGPPRCS